MDQSYFGPFFNAKPKEPPKPTQEQLLADFKTGVQKLTMIALDLNGTKFDYTDEELVDVTVILMEVLMSKMFDKHASNMTKDQMSEVALQCGVNFRQFLMVFTGVDPHEVLKRK